VTNDDPDDPITRTFTENTGRSRGARSGDAS
jgi:hypothetical protein